MPSSSLGTLLSVPRLIVATRCCRVCHRTFCSITISKHTSITHVKLQTEEKKTFVYRSSDARISTCSRLLRDWQRRVLSFYNPGPLVVCRARAEMEHAFFFCLSPRRQPGWNSPRSSLCYTRRRNSKGIRLAKGFYERNGDTILSTQLLEVSQPDLGTVLRLERDAWLLVKILRQATNEYVFLPSPASPGIVGMWGSMAIRRWPCMT